MSDSKKRPNAKLVDVYLPGTLPPIDALQDLGLKLELIPVPEDDTPPILPEHANMFLVDDLDMTVEEIAESLNNLGYAAGEDADDEIEIPPAPEGMSLVEWLVEQSVIPAGTPVYTVEDATDVAAIIEAEGLDKGETIH